MGIKNSPKGVSISQYHYQISPSLISSGIHLNSVQIFVAKAKSDLMRNYKKVEEVEKKILLAPKKTLGIVDFSHISDLFVRYINWAYNDHVKNKVDLGEIHHYFTTRPQKELCVLKFCKGIFLVFVKNNSLHVLFTQKRATVHQNLSFITAGVLCSGRKQLQRPAADRKNKRTSFIR
uniref:Uncharacterized protein n=1 Tax=Glossina palpalis gambiensis TaxID=67801 RepID=A0A1B0BD75_9MUSC